MPYCGCISIWSSHTTVSGEIDISVSSAVDIHALFKMICGYFRLLITETEFQLHRLYRIIYSTFGHLSVGARPTITVSTDRGGSHGVTWVFCDSLWQQTQWQTTLSSRLRVNIRLQLLLPNWQTRLSSVRSAATAEDTTNTVYIMQVISYFWKTPLYGDGDVEKSLTT